MAVPHDFTAGDVLTAAQMDIIANRVVSDVTSGGRPGSPHQGMTIHETDTSLGYIYDGANWVQVDNVGAWTSYTPTWTGSGSNPAIGDGTLVGYYRRHGRSIEVLIYILDGASTTEGTGTYSITLPVAPHATARVVLTGDLLDSGTQHYTAQAVFNNSTTSEEILVGSNAAGPTGWTQTSPFTLAVNDRLVLGGVYPAASSTA